jgi:hypothetical protein
VALFVVIVGDYAYFCGGPCENLSRSVHLYGFGIGAAMVTAATAGLLRIIFEIVRREFRFYFARSCFDVIGQDEEEFEQMRYLKLGLDSYNKYLRRRFKYQISDNNIKKFYFKYVLATKQERNEMINSILQAFDDGKSKPVICISTIMKVPDGFARQDYSNVHCSSRMKMKCVNPNFMKMKCIYPHLNLDFSTIILIESSVYPCIPVMTMPSAYLRNFAIRSGLSLINIGGTPL